MNRSQFLAKVIERWPVKVLSLAAAILISIFYRMNTLETRFFTVPLNIEESHTMLPAGDVINAVKISLRGESNEIQPILEDDIEAYIVLDRFSNEGNYMVPVQIRKKGSALGVEPLEISVLPIEIPVTLEHKVTRNIPVYPIFHGTIASGYELINPRIVPDEVTAEGPRSVMNDINEFTTEPIDIDRRFENFSVNVNIINNNPGVTIIGNRMIEYFGTIRLIARNPVRVPARIEARPVDPPPGDLNTLNNPPSGEEE